MDFARGRPFNTADHQGLEAQAFHGSYIVAQDILTDAALAVLRDPNHRLLFAGVLGIEGLVGKRRGQDLTVRRNYRVLIELIIGMLKFCRHAFHDRVIRLARRDPEDVPFAVIPLLSPAAGDDVLEFWIKFAAAGEGGGSVMI